jgi:hypothetical protein
VLDEYEIWRAVVKLADDAPGQAFRRDCALRVHGCYFVVKYPMLRALRSKNGNVIALALFALVA